MELLKNIIFLVFACLCAIQDMKERKIRFSICAAGAVIGLILCVQSSRALSDILLAMGPAIVMLFLSQILRGSIGSGDGAFAIVGALYLSSAEIIIVVVIAWFLCAIISLMVLFLSYGGQREHAGRGIPFVTVMLLPIMVLEWDKCRIWMV